MAQLKPFEMTESVILKMRQTRSIPARLYNKDGQTIIFPKTEVSNEELEKLFHYNFQGLFYNTDDTKALGINHHEQRISTPEISFSSIPKYDGLTDSRLVDKAMAKKIAGDTEDLLRDLKETTLSETMSLKTRETLNSIFDDFSHHPDAMTGIVNVIEVLGGMSVLPTPQMTVKRTIIAMAMKTRGMTSLTNRDRQEVQKAANEIMMSAMFCDVGYIRMNPNHNPNLSAEDFNYIRTHPLMSFLLVVHDPTLSIKVKSNVLNHHRPMVDHSILNNNYPLPDYLQEKLHHLVELNKHDSKRSQLTQDTKFILSELEKTRHYDEDLQILALASEFASLTTETTWRQAYSPERAIQMIINNSFFTHSDRIIREFLDGISVSLCFNKKIIKEGDFIILNSVTTENKMIWEIAKVITSSRWQSRPGVIRLGTIHPLISKDPKIQIFGFKADTIKPDLRKIHIELAQDPQRRIIYCVNPEFEPELYMSIRKLDQ